MKIDPEEYKKLKEKRIHSVNILIIYTSIIGGFIGGIGSITGKSLKEIFTKKKKRRTYNF